MLYTERVTIRGREFDHTWSDEFTIMRDGVEYDEAYDPIGSGREYVETENFRNSDDEATEADYLAALSDLGVNVNEEN